MQEHTVVSGIFVMPMLAPAAAFEVQLDVTAEQSTIAERQNGIPKVRAGLASAQSREDDLKRQARRGAQVPPLKRLALPDIRQPTLVPVRPRPPLPNASRLLPIQQLEQVGQLAGSLNPTASRTPLATNRPTGLGGSQIGPSALPSASASAAPEVSAVSTVAVSASPSVAPAARSVAPSVAA